MRPLTESMEAAGRTLVAMLAPERANLPLWDVRIDADGTARCSDFWPSHSVGRWWDALLRLEARTGFRIPADAETAMLRYLEAWLDNPLGVGGYLDNREGIPGGPDPVGWFDNHSQRELMLALAALVRFRGSRRALALGRSAVERLDRWIRTDGDWDIPAMAAAYRRAGRTLPEELEAFYDSQRGFRHVESHGRLIEALLEFHLASGDEGALALAARLAPWHLEVSTRADGTAPEAEHTHTHSYLGTLRGLLLFGAMTGRREYVDRVAVTWAVSLRWYVKRSGFVSHDLRTEKDAETGSLGDVVQLALRLGRQGFPELLDDAERLLRCRLLPAQVWEVPGLRPDPKVPAYLTARLAERLTGAFAGMHRHPHGESNPTTDITAADLHALCDLHAHAVEETGGWLQVNLLLDHDDPRVRVRSRRGEESEFTVTPLRAADLRVRVPRWVPEGAARLAVNGKPRGAAVRAGFLAVTGLQAGDTVTIAHPLPREIVVERTDGVDYTIDWRGDEITGISPNAGWLPFYPSR